MRNETIAALRAIIATDPSVTSEESKTILTSIQNAGAGRTRRETGTVVQAAEILGVHRRTIGQYAQRGMLSRIFITPRKIRYDLAEVRRLAGIECTSNPNATQQPAAAAPTV